MTGKFVPFALGCTALLLAACSQTPTPMPAPEGNLPAGSPYAGGKQYPWTDRLDAPGADPYANGRNYDWSSPVAASGAQAQALSGGQNFLSDLDWTSATSGWGPIERDRSNGEQDVRDGTTLRIGGRTFAKGLGVHAASEIKYALGGQCNTFTAFVGIDEEVGKLGSAQFRVFGDGKMLFDSGVRRGGDLSLPVDVSVAGVKELRLVVSDGSDNNFYDHADWGEAALNCVAAQPTGNVVLSGLPYVSATNGWGPVEFDRSNGEQAQFDGKPLTIGGQVFAGGLGMHASSTIAAGLNYDLGGACATFTASIGIDDEVGDRGSVVFQVYGDGQKLFDSGVVRGSDAARSISVDVKNVGALRLALTDAGDTMNFDHADWADAKLDCVKPAQAQSPGTLDPGFGSGGRVGVGGVDVVAEDGGGVAVLDANFKITRLAASGAVLAQSAAMSDGEANAIARQPDGKLVVAGQMDGEMVAVRYLSNLTLDPSFGAGGVKKLKVSRAGNLNTTSTSSVATDVAVQPDGKIVLAGSAEAPSKALGGGGYQPITSDFAVVRLNTDGTLDPGFGDSGQTTTDLEGIVPNDGYDTSQDFIYGLTLQGDGKILVAGQAGEAGGSAAVLARYLTSGQLDPSFSGGAVTSGNEIYSTFRAVTVGPDGQITVGGGTDRFFVTALLQRFNPDGTAGPRATFHVSDSRIPQTVVTSLISENDGSVVVGGYVSESTYVARFAPALTQDASFGNVPGGNVFLGKGTLLSVVNTTDGKIVATTAAYAFDANLVGFRQGQATYRLFR
ncbi:NPCBM/NEW2 domain-containing protein [Deinococcus marmoris]|uniref:Alpha-galactosidase n=1 Tax=Deinococcus marmoris TaxID=249408 RepID=A0A1U7NVV4_9DEIO|nr:NPCBM/NEW2 domain-containing protein [Deinococcus marmoris]OLV17044.1 alpha-galactosidase [Deinococcus marmoris]